MDNAEAKTEKGFAEGEHVVLRPVLEDDLPELAKLMAENPGEREPTPWTHQRLKKKFEDKKEPGLWGKRERYYVIVRKSGGVVGLLREEDDYNRGIYWNELHVADALADRDQLGRDVAATYLAYKQRWHDPLRISFDLLRVEKTKIAWLEACGFELELTQERSVLYRGKPEARCFYTWLSETLLNAPHWEEDAEQS